MKRCYWAALVALLFCPLGAFATHFVGLSVIDKDYMMVQFRDGEVRYRDDGIGKSAYLGHTFVEGDDTLVTFSPRLDVQAAVKADTWLVRSTDDERYANGLPVKAVFRKSKPMNTDHTLTSELDHWLFLQLPDEGGVDQT